MAQGKGRDGGDLEGLKNEGTRNDLVQELLRLAVLQGEQGDVEWHGPRDALGLPFKGTLEGYTASIGRAADSIRRVEAEQPPVSRQDERKVARLLAMPRPRRRVAVCEDSRLQTLGACESLLHLAWEAGFHRPGEAVELAELAVSVAAELSTGDLPRRLVNDYKARSWAVLGNARRISSNLRGAEQAFELAESLIDRGTADPLEEGRLWELKASLCRDSHRLDEADALLRRAAQLYRRCEFHHGLGRVLISRGLVAGRRDEPELAIQLLHRGTESMNPAAEPRLLLVATHNHAFYLGEMGCVDDALDLLAEARLMHQSLGRRMDLTRLRWLEGRLALAAGRVEEAETALVEARESFIRQEIGYDMALVSLDLAGVYARQGRATEMRALAQEMIPIFQSRDLGQEAMAALIVLRNATRMESTAAKLMDELSSLLEASRKGADELLDS